MSDRVLGTVFVAALVMALLAANYAALFAMLGWAATLCRGCRCGRCIRGNHR